MNPGPHHAGHTLLSAALVAMLSLSTVSEAGSSGSGSASAKVLVSASVMPNTSLRIIRQPHELVVTNVDISRGYVEVKASSLIEVKSNSANGYIISFKGISEPFKEVFVQGLGREFQISSGSGWVPRPYTKGAVATELSYRFTLSENTKPGTYAWPLSISVQPL
jgi:hypothetical protein